MKTSVQKQNVTIKGTKAGLVFQLDDQCSFAALLSELETKVAESVTEIDSKDVHVRVHTGNRYVMPLQRDQIKEIIEKTGAIIVDEIASNVVTREEAIEMKRKVTLKSHTTLVRSGQVLREEGDLLVIGDVNPGGTVEATGDIYVLGRLKGIARAGTTGNEKAVVAASVMMPSQIKIADGLYLKEELDREQNTEELAREPTYAAVEIESNEIVFHAINSLATFRRNRIKSQD